jgi:hypothetical protein
MAKSKLPGVERPNGTVYRPRHIRTQTIGYEEVSSVVVFGTHDVAFAETYARLNLHAYWVECDGDDDLYPNIVGTPEKVWWSRTLSHFEDDYPHYHYSVDETKGAAGVRFPVVEGERPAATDDRPDTNEGIPALFESTGEPSND